MNADEIALRNRQIALEEDRFQYSRTPGARRAAAAARGDGGGPSASEIEELLASLTSGRRGRSGGRGAPSVGGSSSGDPDMQIRGRVGPYIDERPEDYMRRLGRMGYRNPSERARENQDVALAGWRKQAPIREWEEAYGNRQADAEQARQLELMEAAQAGDLRAALELEELRQAGRLVLAEGNQDFQREMAEGGYAEAGRNRAFQALESAKNRAFQTEQSRNSGGRASSSYQMMLARQQHGFNRDLQEQGARNALIGTGLLAYDGNDEFGDTVRALDADERKALKNGTLPTHMQEDLSRDVRANRRAFQRSVGGARGMRPGTIAAATAERSGARRDSELASRVRDSWRKDAKRVQEARATNRSLGR